MLVSVLQAYVIWLIMISLLSRKVCLIAFYDKFASFLFQLFSYIAFNTVFPQPGAVRTCYKNLVDLVCARKEDALEAWSALCVGEGGEDTDNMGREDIIIIEVGYDPKKKKRLGNTVLK